MRTLQKKKCLATLHALNKKHAETYLYVSSSNARMQKLRGVSTVSKCRNSFFELVMEYVARVCESAEVIL